MAWRLEDHRRLSALDSSFLQLESARAHMHVGWSAVCSPASDRERPTIAALRARAASRLSWVPRARHRVSFAPLGIGEPYWVDDERFDLDNHVVALSAADEAVSLVRFAQMRDQLLAQPLDRAQPLWQIALVPRLEDGRSALVGRVHHAMADGTAALLVAMLVLDSDGGREDEAHGSPARWKAEPSPNGALRALDPLLQSVERTSRVARKLGRNAVRPLSSAQAAVGVVQQVRRAMADDLLPRTGGGPEPGRGTRRRLVGYRAELADLQTSRGEDGATLNDVGLAMVAGALRASALERDEPVQPLKAMIPVDMRRDDQRAALGNHVAMTAAWLPLHLPSPAARLDYIRVQTERFKRDDRAAGTQALLAAAGLLPFATRGLLIRAAASGRFDLTVSNVRGPSDALSVLGARIEEIYPVVPIPEWNTLSIGMLSYREHMHFGVFADPDAVPEAHRLPALLDAQLRRLQPPAGRSPQRRAQGSVGDQAEATGSTSGASAPSLRGART